MSRWSLLILSLLCVALMGGTTCHFSTNSKKKKGDGTSGSGVNVIVDNRISSGSSTGGSGAGFGRAELVRAALQTSVVPAFTRLAPPRGPDLPGPKLAAAEGVAFVRTPPLRPAEGAGGAVPEPGAALLFAAGAAILAQRFRRRG